MNKSAKYLVGTFVSLLASGQIWAFDFNTNGIYYNKLSDSTVEVTYGGNDTEYGKDYSGDIVIPESVENDKQVYTVVRIGDNAFRGVFNNANNGSLTSVVIPNTVKEIGSRAFEYRASLTSVTLPDQLETMGREAFLLCSALKKIEIPASLKTIPFGAFNSCSKMEYAILHEGLEIIESQAFANCNWLEFKNEDKEKFDSVPNTVTSIGTNVFTNCKYIYNFTVGNNVVWDEPTGWCGFDGCSRLESVELSDGITSIDNYCFRDTQISEFTIKGSVTKITMAAFTNNPKLDKLRFEPSTSGTNLYCWAQDFQNKITNGGTRELTTLEIGREFTYFPFSNLTGLKVVTVLGDKVLETPSFSAEVYENAVLNVPAGMKAQFQAHEQWGKFKNIVDPAEPNEPWLKDVTFNCVAEDGVIYIHPRRIAGLFPYFEPADAATCSNVSWTLANAGTSKEDMIASLYTVNYWNPDHVRFPELQGYRLGECTLTVTVKDPKRIEEDFVKNFTVKVVEDTEISSDENYEEGTIILNEEWYGHTNGSINYLTANNDIIYQAYSRENPGYSFGATSQHGTIWNGYLMVASKQAADGGDPLPGGGRFVIADAKTLKRLGSIDALAWNGHSGDGRAVVGATENKAYVSTSNGIFVIDITNPEAPEITGLIGAKGDNEDEADLYNGQIGDMIHAGRYVFAIKQSYGILVVDPETDELVKRIEDTNVQGITQTADGRVWYATAANGCAVLQDIDPNTLKAGEGRTLPKSLDLITCSWNAWRSTAFYGNPIDNRILFVTGKAGIMGGPKGGYYLYDVDTDPADLQPIFTLTDVTGETEFGETVNLMTYGTPRFDPRNNRIIVMAGREGASSGGYRDHWILLVDATSGEITKNIKLEPYYWFQSLPIFPDKHGVEFSIDEITIDVKDGLSQIDLRDIATDRDSYDCNIAFNLEEIPQTRAASYPVANVTHNNGILTIEPLGSGNLNLNLTATSNGKTTAKTLNLHVDDTTGVTNINSDAKIYSSGSRLYICGMEGVDFVIVDASGKECLSFTADSQSYILDFGVQSGIYIVKGSNGTSAKIAIR